MQKMPQARRSGLIIKEVDDEVLIYDRASDKAHCLNSTAARIWKYCDGTTTVADACTELSRGFGTAVNADLVSFAIGQFSQDDLLEDRVELPAFTGAGISRRQMVRTLGLAAAITLPIVTTMMAPAPAQAATCKGTGVPCTAAVECCNQLCPGAPTGTCA